MATMASNSTILTPYSKSLSDNSLGIMVIARECSETIRLVNCLQAEGKNIEQRLNVRMASSFPLPADNERPGIDLIVFFVHLDDKYSFTVVEKAMSGIDVSYFAGKAVFLAGLGQEPAASVDTRETLQRISSKYDCGVLYARLKNDDEANVIARRTIRLAIAAKKGLSLTF